jgi:hypothetical protein
MGDNLLLLYSELNNYVGWCCNLMITSINIGLIPVNQFLIIDSIYVNVLFICIYFNNHIFF